VHAHAGLGMTTSSRAATMDVATHVRYPMSGVCRSAVLESQLTTAAPNRATQVLELRLDEMVDAVARRRDIVVKFLFDLFARNPFPRIDASIPSEAGAALGELRPGLRRAPGG